MKDGNLHVVTSGAHAESLSCRSNGLFMYGLTPQWALNTVALCLVLFPTADPLLFTPWNEAVQHLYCLVDVASCSGGASGLEALPLPGPAAASSGPAAMSFKDTLLGCVASGDYASLALHFAASCMIGPLWEEARGRGA